MKILVKILTIVLLLCYSLYGFTQTPKALEKIYWTDAMYAKIQRSNLNGSHVEDIVTNVNDPRFMVADNLGKFYFTHGTYIKRANMDGTEVETVLEGLTYPMGIAIKYNLGSISRVFWTEYTEGTIKSANVDGTDIQVVLTDLYSPYCLVVHGDEMYWTDENLFVRAKVDGTQVETIWEVGHPRGIVLDLWSWVVYWTDDAEQQIHKMDLDGGGHEVILVGLNNPKGITLDLDNKKVVWAEFDEGNIQKVDYNGWGPLVLLPDLGNPHGVMAYFDPFGSSSIDDLEITGSWPNPASGSTTISYSLRQASHVYISICDNMGREVDVLANQGHYPGEHQVTWERGDYPAGIYFYLFRVNNQMHTGKILTID